MVLETKAPVVDVAWVVPNTNAAPTALTFMLKVAVMVEVDIEAVPETLSWGTPLVVMLLDTRVNSGPTLSTPT